MLRGKSISHRRGDHRGDGTPRCFKEPHETANIGPMRQVILRIDHEDGGWIAEVPSLPGCLSQGDTKAEALANVKDAITAWVSAAHDSARKVPTDSLDAEIVEIAEEI